MLQAIFKNDAMLAYEHALETEEYWNGTNRRTLTLTCAPEAMPMDTLNALVSDAAHTADIRLQNTETGAQTLYSGYVLKLEISVKPVLTQQETPDAAARYEDRLICRLGRRTYIEEQLARLGL